MGSGSEARRELRQRIAALGPRGITSRVPDDVRAEILAYVTARRRVGVRWREVAEEVGFSVGAVTGWLRQRPRALVPVRVRPDGARPESEAGVRIVLPTGVRIEGLRVGDVPAILAHLA